VGKRFKYQLTALKKLRELKLNMAKAELASVSAQVSACDHKIDDSRDNIGQLLDDQRQTSDMNHVKLFSHLSGVEHDKIDIEMKKLSLLNSEKERHTAYVAFLSSELKAVELHESIKKEEFQKEQGKKLSRQSDELNSISWNQKNRDNK
jgi:hypothetical protein